MKENLAKILLIYIFQFYKQIKFILIFI